jgi:PQQ-like domain
MTLVAAPAATAAVRSRTLWTAYYTGGIPSDAAGAADQVVSPDGSTVYATGFTGYNSDEGSSGGATVAYNAATGAALWTATVGSGSYASSVTMTQDAVSPNGKIVFASGFYNTNKASGSETIAYNAATGATLWTRRYHPFVAAAVSLAVSPDGTTLYVVTETSTVLAYATATGRLLWASASQSAFTAQGVLSPDGSKIFLTGSILVSGFEEYETVAIDTATGAVVWNRRYGSPNATHPDASNLATGIAVSADGSEVFVAGYINGAAGSDAIVAYDSTTGATNWTKHWLPTDHGYANVQTSLAVSPDGSTLYVAGNGGGFNKNGYWVTQARSESTGAVLWSVKNGTAAQDIGSQGIIVSPTMSAIYVIGTLYSDPAGPDYEIAAYGTGGGKLQWQDGTPASGNQNPCIVGVAGWISGLPGRFRPGHCPGDRIPDARLAVLAGQPAGTVAVCVGARRHRTEPMVLRKRAAGVRRRTKQTIADVYHCLRVRY